MSSVILLCAELLFRFPDLSVVRWYAGGKTGYWANACLIGFLDRLLLDDSMQAFTHLIITSHAGFFCKVNPKS